MKKGRLGVLASLALAPLLLAQVESLPAPVAHGNSFEILANSRYSVHSGFTGNLPRLVLSNVLWAMNRAPSFGGYHELYVATPDNVYTYNSVAHALVLHRTGDFRYNSGSAFEVGIACESDVEAGMAVQAGLLAGTAFWNPDSAVVASCPMKYAALHADSFWNPAHPILMTDVFGRAVTTGLSIELQAHSSDSSLPSPGTSGSDTFEIVMAGLRPESLFSPAMLAIQDVSQLLWAGCGVTPHLAYNGNRGTTIPSAVGLYYLTRQIFLVADTAVFRYNNRLPPGTGLTTSDHNLEELTSGDRRPQLRAGCSRIPSTAPVYVVVCVEDTTSYRGLEEAGCAGFQYLTQAAGLGLRGWLTTGVTPSEGQAIRQAMGIPGILPVIVFSCGSPPAGVAEAGAPPLASVTVRVSGNHPPLHLDYELGSAVAGRLVVYDLAGRAVRSFSLAPQTAGPHGFDWDGLQESGRPAPAGVYVARLEAGGAASASRFVLSR